MLSLYQSARNGDIESVQKEINKVFSDFLTNDQRQQALAQKDQYGLTALHYAVKYNHLEIVKLLIENGVDINVRGKDGATPIHYVTCFTRGTDASLLRFLIVNGADINATDDLGCSPLHHACHKGNIRVVQVLTQNAENKIDSVDQLQNTPLHNACSFGLIEIVDILISKGVNLLSENDVKFTPLHVTCSQGHEELLNHLLDTVEKKYGIAMVNTVIEQKNLESQNLLHLAVLGSHVNITKSLLERGCDIDSRMEGEETALHIAAVTGNKEIVDLLLRFMTNSESVDAVNINGRTALHKAARFGKYSVVTQMLLRGADVDLKDEEGITPLILASNISGNSQTIKILLDHGANVLLTDREDRTALHVATTENNLEGVKMLLKHDKYMELVNLKDKDSNTSLHIACREGYEDIAVYLMAKKADVKSRNNNNETPLHLAACFGQENVVDNILDINSSTINDIDKDGNAPLHLAANNGHSEVIKYLLKCGAAVDDKNAKSLTPLDCAANHGHTEAAKTLVWGGASLDQRKETGFTPLHYSCMEGHVETTKYLLELCDVGLTDSEGRNPLDLAIDHLHEGVAKVIIDHRDWKRGLRNKSIENGLIVTPIRKMIQRMPEVAFHAFSRCIGTTDDKPNDDEDYEAILTYEFVDDVYGDWPLDNVFMDSHEGRAKGEKLSEIKLQKLMESKDTHTYTHMIKYRRKDLLLHPLIQASIEKKWQQFAAYIYYFKLLLYILFLFFLTGYILVTARLQEPLHKELNTCTIKYQEATWDITLFLIFGKYIVLMLSGMLLMFEIIQLFGQRLEYFTLENLLEWIIYGLAITSVFDDFVRLPYLWNLIECGKYHKSFNAVSMFLSWLNFILFIRKVPVFGIYIVMFLYVTETFFRFLVVFSFLIIAFGFSFCVLLQDKNILPAFQNPFESLVKTGVMMTGELGFDDIFHNENHMPDAVLWVIFVCFVLLMNIVLMNLLIGLAVDDIQSVQREAEMTKAMMQIELCLYSEKSLPKCIRQRLIVPDQTVFLNRNHKEVPKNITKQNFIAIKKLVGKKQEPLDRLTSHIKTVHTNVNQLDRRIEYLDEKINELSVLNTKIDTLQSLLKDVLRNQQKHKKKRSSSDQSKTRRKSYDDQELDETVETPDDDNGGQ